MSKVNRTDFSGYFTDLKGDNVTKEEIHTVLGNLLYNHYPEDENSLRCVEMAQRIYKNKMIDISEEEKTYLEKLVKELKLKSGFYVQIMNRINNK